METENTCLYQSDFTHDINVQKEFLKASLYTNSYVKFLHLFIIGILLWFFYAMFFLLDAPEQFSVGILRITALYLIIEGVRLLSHRKGGIHFKRTLLTNGGEPVHCSIQFRETDILSVNLTSNGQNTIQYDQIKTVYETKNLFLCALKYRLFLIVDKRTLSGEREDFTAFLLSHCPNIRRKKVHNIKASQIINGIKWVTVFIMLAIALIFHPSIQLKQRLSGQIHNGMSTHEILTELENFGITCDDPEMVETMYGGTFYYYGSRLESILHYIGMGTYDYEKEIWAPSENGVSFTTYWNFEDHDTMYTNLLNGIASLVGRELSIENIQEDHSETNYITGEGSVIVEFELLGSPYTLEAAVNGDLYDIQLLNEINRIISEHTGNSLYFVDYENTGIFIFYGDASWANSFSQRTGLELTTYLQALY